MLSSRQNDPLGIFRGLTAVALVLCGYGAYLYLNAPEVDPARYDIGEDTLERSVELNYQLDLQRMESTDGQSMDELPPDWESKHKQAIRKEILAMAAKEKREAEEAEKRGRSYFFLGLALLVFAGGRIFAKRLRREPGPES